MDKGEIIEKVDDRVKNSDNNKRVKKRVKIESQEGEVNKQEDAEEIEERVEGDAWVDREN